MPKLNLTKRRTKKEDEDQNDEDQQVIKLKSKKTKATTQKSGGITKVSLVSKSITQNEQPRIKTRLVDKLETPAARQKRTLKEKPTGGGSTFSLVDRRASQEVQVPMRQSTCIVCLKINKSLFNQIFKKDGKTNIRGEHVDPFKTHEESISNMSAELQMELSQDKTLDVPQIYGLTPLDIQPEKVNFKQYGDIDEDCLNQKINTRSLSEKKIHLILASFKNKKWPNSSPYVCWNCTESFDGAPVGIPTIAMSDSYEDTYYLEGNFCSFNCAARHLFSTHSAADSQLFTIYEIMNFIYNELLDDDQEYEKIKLAPERICLKKFGGHLSLEEYRKNFNTKVKYEVFKSPLIPALYHIQENTDLTRLIRNQNRKKNKL